MHRLEGYAAPSGFAACQRDADHFAASIQGHRRALGSAAGQPFLLPLLRLLPLPPLQCLPAPLVLALAMVLLPGAALGQVAADPYSYSRTSSYSYDAGGRLLSESAEPDSAAWCVLSSYSYDAWGNRVSATQANCGGAVPARQQFASRTSSHSYAASKGLFPTAGSNALGQSHGASFDARFGTKTSATDIAGLTLSWTLDAFGRVVRQSQPDGTSTITRYCWLPGRVSDITSNSAGCETSVPGAAPADAVSYLESEPRNTADAKMGPTSRIYRDRLGRELRRSTQGFDGPGQPGAYSGALIVSDKVYSAVGSLVLQSQPYYHASGSSTTTGANDQGLERTDYDALGRVVARYTSDPQGQAGATSFGAWGSRNAARTSHAYSALRSSSTNDHNHSRHEETDIIGRLLRVTDAAGAQLAHQHDAFGNLIATKDALQNTITIVFDIRGRRLQIDDPDAGLSRFDYNALGELVWSETARQRAQGQATTMAYDLLGRMTSRSEPEGSGSWSYDRYIDQSSCNKGAGRLCESRYVRAGSSDTRSTRHYYDELGRPTSEVLTTTNGPTLASARSYDASTGRQASRTYPSGIKVGWGYTALGQPAELTLQTPASLTPLGGGGPSTLAAHSVLWQARIVDAWGKTEQQRHGNGITSRATRQPETGRTTALDAGPGTARTTLDHSYAWDSLNKLTWRADHIGDAVAGAVTESFEYGDSLSRLTRYTVAAPAVPGGQRQVELSYNALGMLLAKSDVGVYTYGASGAGAVRPHALLSLALAAGGSNTYSYDANGNLSAASGGKYRTIAYTSFNLPDSQSGIGGAPGTSPDAASAGTARYSWNYDENRQRIKEVRTITGGSQAGTRTTWMLHPDNAGGLGFEQEINAPIAPSAQNPAGTHNRHYLSIGGQTIGVLVTSGSLSAPVGNLPPAIASANLVKLEYWHQDRLGSLVATSDHAGQTTARYAYDPFGKRRYANGNYDAFAAVVVDWSQAAAGGTDRGYTGQEHLDDVGLIHMNGRLFDPTTARFVQADPHITHAHELQNYDRYAYCLNNPLTCTDPTGLDNWGNESATGHYLPGCRGAPDCVDVTAPRDGGASGLSSIGGGQGGIPALRGPELTVTARRSLERAAMLAGVYLPRVALLSGWGAGIVIVAQVCSLSEDCRRGAQRFVTAAYDFATDRWTVLTQGEVSGEAVGEPQAGGGVGGANSEGGERIRGLPPEGVAPPAEGEVKPGPASRPSERDKGGQSLWDDKGGEWRYSPEDKWHNPHWDYNPHDKPSSPWQNVPIGPLPPRK